MPKLFFRIAASLLVPCFVTDPATAAALRNPVSWATQKHTHSKTFCEQALTARHRTALFSPESPLQPAELYITHDVVALGDGFHQPELVHRSYAEGLLPEASSQDDFDRAAEALEKILLNQSPPLIPEQKSYLDHFFVKMRGSWSVAKFKEFLPSEELRQTAKNWKLKEPITDPHEVERIERLEFQAYLLDYLSYLAVHSIDSGPQRTREHRATLRRLLDLLQRPNTPYGGRWIEHEAQLFQFPNSFLSMNEEEQLRRERAYIDLFSDDPGPNAYSLRVVQAIGPHLRGLIYRKPRGVTLSPEHQASYIAINRVNNGLDYSVLVLHLTQLMKDYQQSANAQDLAAVIAAGLSVDPQAMISRPVMESIHPEALEGSQPYSFVRVVALRWGRFYPRNLSEEERRTYFSQLAQVRTPLLKDLREYALREPEAVAVFFGQNTIYSSVRLLQFWLVHLLTPHSARSSTYEELLRLPVHERHRRLIAALDDTQERFTELHAHAYKAASNMWPTDRALGQQAFAETVEQLERLAPVVGADQAVLHITTHRPRPKTLEEVFTTRPQEEERQYRFEPALYIQLALSFFMLSTVSFIIWWPTHLLELVVIMNVFWQASVYLFPLITAAIFLQAHPYVLTSRFNAIPRTFSIGATVMGYGIYYGAPYGLLFSLQFRLFAEGLRHAPESSSIALFALAHGVTLIGMGGSYLLYHLATLLHQEHNRSVMKKGGWLLTAVSHVRLSLVALPRQRAAHALTKQARASPSGFRSVIQEVVPLLWAEDVLLQQAAWKILSAFFETETWIVDSESGLPVTSLTWIAREVSDQALAVWTGALTLQPRKGLDLGVPLLMGPEAGEHALRIIEKLIDQIPRHGLTDVSSTFNELMKHLSNIQGHAWPFEDLKRANARAAERWLASPIGRRQGERQAQEAHGIRQMIDHGEGRLPPRMSETDLQFKEAERRIAAGDSGSVPDEEASATEQILEWATRPRDRRHSRQFVFLERAA